MEQLEHYRTQQHLAERFVQSEKQQNWAEKKPVDVMLTLDNCIVLYPPSTTLRGSYLTEKIKAWQPREFLLNLCIVHSTDEARQRISASLSSDRKEKGAGAFFLLQNQYIYFLATRNNKFSPMGEGEKVLTIKTNSTIIHLHSRTRHTEQSFFA